MRVRFLLFLFAAALVAGGLSPARGQMYQQAPPPPLPAGKHAPPFRIMTRQGKPLSLRSLRGKVVLLDYWATWCGPCRIATPALERLHRQFGPRGLTVIGMDVDDPSTVPLVKVFVKRFGITYPVSAPGPGVIRAAQAYHVDGIPSQYLIDRRGIVRWSQSGYSLDEPETLPKLVSRLLREKARKHPGRKEPR